MAGSRSKRARSTRSLPICCGLFGFRVRNSIEFLARAIVIQISPIKMFGQSEMSFARIGSQATQGLNRSIGQGEALWSVIVLLPVKLVVGVSQFIICKREGAISR